MDNINREIETYWRELFAGQIEECIYLAPNTTSPDEKWFLEGAKYALMILRHTRTDDFTSNS